MYRISEIAQLAGRVRRLDGDYICDRGVATVSTIS